MGNPVIRPGVKTKLFGIVMVFLGILDSLLSWRGGFTASKWYVMLIALGLFLYAVGAIRGSGGLVAAHGAIPRSRRVEGGSP